MISVAKYQVTNLEKKRAR